MMVPEHLTDGINAAHMRDYGLHMLARGVLMAAYSEMYNPYAHASGVIMCASASEILLKARIVEAHPLLIFTKLPIMRGTTDDTALLLENGRTVVYNELPNLLLAAAGFTLPNKERFLSFGQLRNRLIHATYATNQDLPEETLRFAFTVMEPAIEEFWGESVFNYTAEHFFAEEDDEGLREALNRLGIQFRYPDR